MARNKRLSVAPLFAHLAGIEVVGDLEKNNSTTRPDHFAIVYVDDMQVANSEKKPRVPSPRWEWPEDHQFRFQPSSTIKIAIYREGRIRIAKHLIGQYSGKVIELLENNVTVDLEDKTGVRITSGIKITLSLISESEDKFESLMVTVGADSSTIRASASVLAMALQLTKSIMDIVASAHPSPILTASLTVMSVVYEASRQQGELRVTDNTVRDNLAESLREMLGVAKEYPDLLLITGTSVVEEIGRASLQVASLIHELMQLTFISM